MVIPVMAAMRDTHAAAGVQTRRFGSPLCCLVDFVRKKRPLPLQLQRQISTAGRAPETFGWLNPITKRGPHFCGPLAKHCGF